MPTTKAKRYRFKGWDWTELGECWGLADPDSESLSEDDEKAVAERIRERIERAARRGISGDVAPEDRQTVEDVRRFVHAIAAAGYQSGRVVLSDAPLWRGLSRCGDEALLTYTHRLLEYMWT